MASIFDRILANRPKTSVFDLSHEKKLTCDMAKLVPICVQEVLPGDKFRINTEVMIRCAPMVAPIMHRVNVYTHYFFVPNRLVWSNWEKFITGQKSQLGIPYEPPTWGIHSDLLKNGTLLDYMGVPTKNVITPTADAVDINMLPFKAYQLIWNEYYRDQNLQDEIEIGKDEDGYTSIPASGATGAYEILKLRNRCWEKDYFTSALPWTQKGDPVTIPVGGTAPVVLNNSSTVPLFKRADNSIPAENDDIVAGTYLQTGKGRSMKAPTSNNSSLKIDPNGTLDADLSNATASTINELRTAFQIQKWLERNARSGTRYIEHILSHFGVRSSDSRLQRPEYLGGGKSPIVVSEVLQTSSTDSTSPQGNPAGHGISVQNSHSFNKSFEEHGFIIGIMSVLPRTAYQQGLNRMFSRNSFLDYYFPEFANLGEQEVKNKEIFVEYGSASMDMEFGYQARYQEYRYQPSTVHGSFRENMDFWHLGRKFNSLPSLNEDFVEANPDKRPFAVESEHVLWCQIYNNIQAIRPIPYVAEPGLIDH